MPQEILTTEAREQRVLVSAVDRMGRLAQGRPFLSTMAAHIFGSGGTQLKAYYPLLDPAGPVQSAAQYAQPNLTAVPTAALAAAGSSLAFGQVAGPPAEDARFPLWTPHLNSFNSTDGSIGLNTGAGPALLTNTITLTGTDALVLVAWANLSSASVAVDDQLPAHIQGTGTFMNLRRHNGVGGNWRMEMTFDFVSSLDLDHTANVATDRWTQVAGVIRLSPNSQELWVDGSMVSSAVGGVPPASLVYNYLQIGLPWWGSLAHVQVYLVPSGFDLAGLLSAQRQVALTGLERQTTGQRVQSILAYAGVPAAEYAGTIDTGASAMQRATLAGKDPLSALREAEVTEQGLLYVDGSGVTHFVGRPSLYGI
jgi:hypothetical protein